jgi:hypothetical protein
MIRSALAMAAVTLGVAAPVASAHPAPHGRGSTDPVASALCSRVAAGNPPSRLAADTAQITAACTTLTGSSTQTLTTYQTAGSAIAGQVKATLATVRAARQTAEQTRNWTAYATVVAQARVTLTGLRSQLRSAQRSYTTAIRAARQTFWTTIRALAGARSLPSDSGTPTAPTAPGVPSGVLPAH